MWFSFTACDNPEDAQETPPEIITAQTPVITSQPAGATVTINATPTLSVAASVSDGGELSYQWYSNSSASATGGTQINGAAAVSYSPPTDKPGTFHYFVEITNTILDNGDGGVKTAALRSNAATLIVNEQVINQVNAQTPVITSQPTGATVTVNAPYTLSVTASVSDGGALSYQWYSNSSASATGGTQINGAATASYIPPTDKPGTFHYFVEITNIILDNGDGGIKKASVRSGAATLIVNEQVINQVNAQTPVITNQPAGAAVTVNAPYTLSVTASVSDGGTLSYQWYSNSSASATGGTQISGAIFASYSPPTDKAGIFHYFVEITNTIPDNGDGGAKNAALRSNAATLTVNEQVINQINAQTPVITNQPAGAAITANAPYALSVTASVSDGGTLSYQWYSNSSASTSGGTPVTGAAAASYSPPTDKAGIFHYFVEITNTIPDNGDGGIKKASVRSNAATLTVNAEVSNELIKRVEFTGPTAIVNFSNLDNKNVYLVKINTSSSDISAANTGGVRSIFPKNENYDKQLSANGPDALPRMGHPAADAFSANPPPIDKKSNKSPDAPLASSVSSSVGETKQFWVESSYNNGNWVQRTATLSVQGAYGNIWVINDSITSGQAKAMSDKFDIIYPAGTNILGYEYGGGPGGNGGKDSDSKIQILVYNIGGNTLGYFWGKDYYDQSALDNAGLNLKTNIAEIFYINSSYVSSNLDLICSTQAHEFQHMINFNEKTVKRGLSPNTWYNEMLSMMTQDVIEGLIDITPAHQDSVIKSRIPLFLRYYTGSSFTNWYQNDSTGINYGKGYAFGAYLLRNYGGAALLKEILANNAADAASITAAIKTITGVEISFEEALRRFGETMIFSGAQKPAGLMTFDKTVTSNINNFTYTAHGFDIWNMSRSSGGLGPYLSDLGAIKMDSHSITVHQSAEWKDKSGSLSITLERPVNSNIEFYLMVK
jgi:hypothetical protein